MPPFSCCWTKRYLFWSKWEFWFISPQSKLVWSSGCFQLRQQRVVKWNTLDCWFQQLLKLPLCFLLVFFERLSAILMLFFIYLFIQQTDWKHFVRSVLMWCWNDTKLLVFPIGSSGFSRCKDKNVDFANFIDLIYSIIYIIYHFTGGLEVKVRFWNCLTLSSTHTHIVASVQGHRDLACLLSCCLFPKRKTPVSSS